MENEKLAVPRSGALGSGKNANSIGIEHYSFCFVILMFHF
jgi:hypothetical protein